MKPNYDTFLGERVTHQLVDDPKTYSWQNIDQNRRIIFFKQIVGGFVKYMGVIFKNLYINFVNTSWAKKSVGATFFKTISAVRKLEQATDKHIDIF